MAFGGDVYISLFIVEAWGGTDFGAVDIPAFKVEATGTFERSEAWLTLPNIIVSASGLVGVIGAASIDIPVFTVEGGSRNIYGTSALELPVIQIYGSSYTGIYGAGAIELPVFIFDITSLLDVFGNTAITVPTFIIDGRGRATSGLNFRTIVMNMSNHAVTEYGNFGFNSLAAFGDDVLLSNSSGLYRLNGKLDSGNHQIDSFIMMGLTDMHKDYLRYAREAWITAKSDGDLLLVVKVDENIDYDYTISQPNNASAKHVGTRTKIGRGIKSRFVEFGLKNKSGNKFEVSSIRIMGETSPRRTR